MEQNRKIDLNRMWRARMSTSIFETAVLSSLFERFIENYGIETRLIELMIKCAAHINLSNVYQTLLNNLFFKIRNNKTKRQERQFSLDINKLEKQMNAWIRRALTSE